MGRSLSTCHENKTKRKKQVEYVGGEKHTSLSLECSAFSHSTNVCYSLKAIEPFANIFFIIHDLGLRIKNTWFLVHNLLLFCLCFCPAFISFCFNERNETISVWVGIILYTHLNSSLEILDQMWLFGNVLFFLSSFFFSSASHFNETLHCFFFWGEKKRKRKKEKGILT